VYETAGLERVLAAVDGAVPVLVTVRPLRSFDEAEYLRYEVPDVTIPTVVMDRMERAGAGGARVGLDIAAELAAEAGTWSAAWSSAYRGRTSRRSPS
jgi:methionine synthase / methylenetetrahydrofolate reductase(NADPH)